MAPNHRRRRGGQGRTRCHQPPCPLTPHPWVGLYRLVPKLSCGELFWARLVIIIREAKFRDALSQNIQRFHFGRWGSLDKPPCAAHLRHKTGKRRIFVTKPLAIARGNLGPRQSLQSIGYLERPLLTGREAGAQTLRPATLVIENQNCPAECVAAQSVGVALCFDFPNATENCKNSLQGSRMEGATNCSTH